jgi:hypothetical protein
MHLNILDLVNVRLEGKPSSITNYVRHEYGLFEVQKPSSGKPEIIIEFLEDVSSTYQSVHVRSPVSYDDHGVFLHDPQYHVVRIDFDVLGQSNWRVTCDVNFNPHFFAIIMEYLIHFTLLKKDAVLCHSSAFQVDSKVVLCPAWRNVGKTNVLLSFLMTGAQYIADDWSVVLRTGLVHSLPKRLNLLYYNFAEYPELLRSLPEQFAALVDFVKRAKLSEYDLNHEIIETLTNQARMRVSVDDLFNQTFNTEPIPIDYVFLLKRNKNINDSVKTSRIELDALVHSVYSILEFEQSHFQTAYLAHKAITGRANPFLEQAKSITLNILSEAFKRVPQLYQITVPSQHKSKDVHHIIMETLKSNH